MRANVPPINPHTVVTPVSQHRKQMLWQVWVPLGVTLAIVLALAILAVIGTVQGSSQVNKWGNISAVWVILPVLFCGLIFMALFGASAYGLSVLLKKTPGWMLKVQLLLIHLALTIRRASDTATKPVMAVNTFSTRVGTLWEQVFGRRHTR